jgi:hypothetical protein
MRIKLYRPTFVDGFDDVYYEVKSKEELLDSELCKVWTKDGYDIAFYFKPLQSAIMAIKKDRKSWWVIALIDNKPDMELLKDWLPDFDELRRNKL